ncbi:MAG: hypothetical protein ACLR9R_03160 [Faecalibacterium prausnitzii]
MGGRGSSMRGSQGMGGGTGAPAAAAQAMPTVRAAPAVQQAGPPTGATGFGHLTPQQVAAFENAAQQQMQRDPALAAGVVDYINPVMQSNSCRSEFSATRRDSYCRKKSPRKLLPCP